MIFKGFLSLMFISAGAYGLAEYLPPLLDYYYALLVAVAMIYGARTLSFSYSGMMVLLVGVYAVENNFYVWNVDTHILPVMYIFAAVMVLIFKTDDGLWLANAIAGIVAFKFFTSVNLSGYWLHTTLNFLSIAQWIVFIAMSAERIQLNKGYTKKENPFMLFLAHSWNRLKIFSETTKSA